MQPQARAQIINNEAVLEITETVVQKTQHSETDLLRQKQYFEEMLAKAQDGLDRVNSLIAQLEDEKAKLP